MFSHVWPHHLQASEGRFFTASNKNIIPNKYLLPPSLLLLSTFQEWHIKETIVATGIAFLSNWKFNLEFGRFSWIAFHLARQNSHLHFQGNTFFWAIQMQNMKCNLISERKGNALQNYVSKNWKKTKKENMLNYVLIKWYLPAYLGSFPQDGENEQKLS